MIWVFIPNWPNSQIPQCTCSTSHNAQCGTEMCNFYHKWCIVGYGIGALWDFCEIALLIWLVSSYLSCNVNSVMHDYASGKNTWIKLFMQNDFTVVLKIFTADIEYQFSRGHDTQFWHLMCHCHLGPFRTMHQITHKHTEIDLLKATVFFFRLLNYINPAMVYHWWIPCETLVHTGSR